MNNPEPGIGRVLITPDDYHEDACSQEGGCEYCSIRCADCEKWTPRGEVNNEGRCRDCAAEMGILVTCFSCGAEEVVHDIPLVCINCQSPDISTYRLTEDRWIQEKRKAIQYQEPKTV